MRKAIVFVLLSGFVTALLMSVLIGGVFWIASLAGTDVNILFVTLKAAVAGFFIGIVLGLFGAMSVHNHNDL